MNKQSIIIYDFEILFNILNEIKENLKFEVFNFKKNYNISNLDNNVYGNYLITFNPLDNSIKNSIKKNQLFFIIFFHSTNNFMRNDIMEPSFIKFIIHIKRNLFKI